MAQVLPSTYTRYNQTEQEQLAGSSFSTEQKQFIQNQLGMLAEERLALVPDPNNYAKFIQEEAFIKGQMALAQWLLDCSEESEKNLLALAEAQALTS